MFEPSRLVPISLSNRPGGTEQCLRIIAEASGRRIIYVQKDASYKIEAGNGIAQQFVTDGSLWLGFLKLIPQLIKYRRGYMLLSSAVYLNGWLGLLKRTGYLRSELIFRESTTIFSRFTGLKRFSYEMLYRLGYPAASLVICQTDAMRDEFLKHNQFVAAGKVVTLHNPVDLKKVHECAQNEHFTEQGDFICAAGRLIPVKGFDYLIKAFYTIAGAHKRLKMIVLGDGPERDSLLGLIKQLGMEDRVILKGFVENPYPYFKKARLCVVSSIKEGFPNVLLQMMALNNTIVSTLCAGGIKDIPGIIKAETGNSTALSQAIDMGLRNLDLNRREIFDQYLFNRSPKRYLENLQKELDCTN